MNYEILFVDYDDTFKYIEKTLLEINKPVVVITRSKIEVDTIYPTVYVKDNELKSNIINDFKKVNPIFVDDSFRERKDVFLNCGIPSITPEEINYLL